MNEIDDKIREALAAEDAELFAQFETEPSLLQMVRESFHGRNRWLVAVGYIVITVFFVIGVFCGVQFFQSDSVEDKIMWAGFFFFACLAIISMKIWYWMELNKNLVNREIKRVELQIAQLSRRLAAKS